MTTSNGSANPLYPFNWLDAVRANAWAPPNLPLFGDGVARNSWDRFPLASSASTRGPDPESAAAYGASAANVMPTGGATAASDVPLDGPRAAPISWDSFPLAQPTTEHAGQFALTHLGLTQGAASANTAGPGFRDASAEAFPRGFAHAGDESVLSDIVKNAIPGGLERAAIGFVGAPADTNEHNKFLGSKIGDLLGISPETQSKIGAGYDLAAKTGLLGPLLSFGTISPTSDTIKSAIEEKFGPLPEAQTVPGQYVQTGFEFLPALLGNKGSFLRGLATNVVGPAIASETAGQLTKGTAAEPYMRMLAAILGGVAGARLGEVAGNARFARTAPHASGPGNVDDVADVVPPITRKPPIRRESVAADQVVVHERPDGEQVSSPAIRPGPSMTFDYSRMDEWPNVPQFNLERREPPLGAASRIQALDNPDNIARVNEYPKRGLVMRADQFYNTAQLRARFIDELGEVKGGDAFNRFIDFIAATSPASRVDQNIRNASYFFHLNEHGLAIPRIEKVGSRWRLLDQVPREYWHPLEPLYVGKINEILNQGGLSSIDNPKLTSFAQNLKGNLVPVTIDRHGVRMWGLLNANGNTMRAPRPGDYGYIERLMQREARNLGLAPAQYQSAAWAGGAEQTGVRSSTDPWLKSFETRITATAQKHGLPQEEVLRRFIRGQIPLLSLGAALAGIAAEPERDEGDM